MPEKSEEELKKEQDDAKKQLDEMFSKSKPKNLADGLGKGVNSIVGGALGGVGIAVAAPTIGLATGLKKGGIVGGLVGVTGGVVVGAVGGAVSILGGAVSGVTQIVRGAAATPGAIKAQKEGKWWNENTHKWVLTNLETAEIPENDDDLLNEIKNNLDEAGKPGGTSPVDVKDAHYYNILEVDPKADSAAIKRRYYILARKYHPDRVGIEDMESAEKFKEIAEAYQVLSDPKLRKKYDTDGREALSGDKTDINGNQNADPAILVAFLFGSDKFNDYFGRLATSTSAMLGDSESLSMEDARILQERRCIRLARKLVTKIQPWIEGEFDLTKATWASEAEELSKASYGYELIQLLGMAYEVTALQFLGSTESGIGMPSIGKWAEAQKAKRKKKKAGRKNEVDTMMAALDTMISQQEYEKKILEAKTEEEKAALQRELEEATQASMLRVIWTTTTVDITSTIHETCQMVFFDRSVDKEVRKQRANAVKNLGAIFQATPPPLKPTVAAKDLFEEAALAAMVETLKRKDEASFSASFRNK